MRASSPQASYTKAIKAEPENHVFFSNRSQAFLKLSKVTKVPILLILDSLYRQGSAAQPPQTEPSLQRRAGTQ